MEKRAWKRLAALLLCAAVAFASAGCGLFGMDSAGPESAKPAKQSGGSAEIQLTDQAGREVVLEKPAETLVSCYYITTYATVALGVADRVIGLEKKADTRPIYRMAAPGLLEQEQVGSLKEFNVEAVAALAPDLVLMPRKLKDHAETLTELGIPVLVVDPETQEGMEQMLALIGKACGAEDQAAALTAYYGEQLSRMADLTKGQEKPRVYMGGNSSYLTAAPGGMYQSSLIKQAGGTNVAQDIKGDYWTEVSYESILAMDPEYIIVPSGASYTANDIRNDPQLAGVGAVAHGNVYEMPRGIEEWDAPIPSGVLGVMWLTSVLHPGQYSFDTFVSDAQAFYQTFYGFALDAALVTK
ncbi:ABC transporter substrate-binding protein [Agathobaculum sp.]|uniref:ABC transporter substrate-binding protein n=1 Tax=Agathobaculum sp. TaxID=2048138 RepID=UPI002A816F58|nr:ABC transporter substrate-binding protein [Agathobaculum sp.]MDY3619222.1 ABC transporter substrate-binding protein [Agathobaculum sp.]